MYNNNFVAVIKSNGKILREDVNNVIRLPFGSNYSILLKNLNTVDVVVDIEIDGENVLQGHNLVISPNIDFELSGKLKNLNKSNKFKFIQKTKQINDYRGDKVDDGIIRITYSFVKPQVINEEYSLYPVKFCSSPNYYGTSEVSCSYNTVQEGITTKGEEFDCGFSQVTVGDLDSAVHIIIFKLVGKIKNKKKIKKHLYVNTILVCETCGNKSKSSKKYCSNCGTYLR